MLWTRRISMKNHWFPWLRNRTTDNRKCEKARNIKEKRTIEMFSTAWRLHAVHRSSPRDNCAPGVPIQKHSKPPTEFPVGRLFACSKGFIDVYKFLIRIFAIGGRASLLCVYFDALIFKGKSMLRWQEGFYLYKGNWGVCSCRREGIPHLAYFSACLCGILPVGGQ